MNEELRQKATKIVEAKKGFYTVAIVFGGAAVILFILMFAIPDIAPWLLLAFPAFALVLGVLYINAFGFPGTDKNADNWEEAEIEKEMHKLSQRNAAPPAYGAASDSASLELKELEQISLPETTEEDFV